MVAVAIALLARRSGTLSAGGPVAAMVVGTAAIAAGWIWGALLVLFFVTSVGWSRWRADTKDARTAGVVAKAGARDAAQVSANGAVFAVAAALLAISESTGYLVNMTPALSAGALGALCTATADTWATEVGVGVGASPRALLTGRAIDPGMSGGVTLAGTVGGVTGAAFIAVVALGLGASAPVAVAGAIGGVAGMLADSALGGIAQARRWCDACGAPTERDVHSCGAVTRHAGGLVWLTNDWVNAVATGAGALIAALLVYVGVTSAGTAAS